MKIFPCFFFSPTDAKDVPKFDLKIWSPQDITNCLWQRLSRKNNFELPEVN